MGEAPKLGDRVHDVWYAAAPLRAKVEGDRATITFIMDSPKGAFRAGEIELELRMPAAELPALVKMLQGVRGS